MTLHGGVTLSAVTLKRSDCISKSMKQKSYIKFCVKNAINGTQTFEMLQNVMKLYRVQLFLIGIGCLKKVVNLLKMIIILDGHKHQTTMKIFPKIKDAVLGNFYLNVRKLS